MRALWRLARALLHGVHGLLIVLLLFPWLGAHSRRERVRWWAAKMLRMLGIELRVQGRFRPGAKLIVANHVSWLDVMSVHAVCPEARFVSKADVQRWPLVVRDDFSAVSTRRPSRVVARLPGWLAVVMWRK
ncbi:MAG: hypothetical protein ABT20_18525 [Rubrivivax sp. SCN 70-15]|nr:MAG: hypothetical protein ABT20_18525 [Rubrivivax sp. SCN 70-15]